MSVRPTIGFDTSVINELERDGAQSEPLMKALNCGFDVRVLGMSTDEIVSTPTRKAKRRAALLARCQRLLASGQCIWPPNAILELLISAHFRNPSQFEWREVDVRARGYEQAIIRRDFPDKLCLQQLEEQKAAQRDFEDFWKRLRPKLAAIRAQNPEKWPMKFEETFPIIRADGNGVLWEIGRHLYKHVTKTDLNDSQIRAFMDVCPPFRAAAHALCLSWYDRCVRPPDTKPTYKAKRNDMMMSVYLPYCGRFITAEKKREQERCLRMVASASDVVCDVLSYEKFNASLTVAA